MEGTKVKKKELLIQRKNDHVSLDTLKDFEQKILEDCLVSKKVSSQLAQWIGINLYRLYRLYRFFGGGFKGIKLLSKVCSKYCEDKFVIQLLMGPRFEQCLPYFLFYKKKSIYIFDAWDKSHDDILYFLRALSVDYVFFSSYQVANKFKTIDSSREYIWIPEAIDPEQYDFKSFEDKNIDVLQIGRRFDFYHDKIANKLFLNGYKYIYEEEKGKIIFAERNDFVDGLARAKISICVPSNITHPDRAGGISTMTNRYLQSMASKCLIVGVLPEEMRLLFGYNPIVEIDMADPFGQIQNILNNYEEYYDLIDKNYGVVCRDHSWSNRFAQINRFLLNDEMK